MQNLGAQINRAVYHEYTHLILNRSASRLPLWLEEGSAEMFSTMAVSKNNVQVGAGLAYAVALLRGKRLLSGEELQAVRHTSPIYNEGKRAGPFYAQSWAVVHMLNFDPRYSGRIGYFLNALDDQETEEAFAAAFGKTLNEAMDDLKEYIQQDRFQMMIYKVPVTRFQFKEEAEALSEKDAALVLCDLLLELRRPQEAADLISEFSAEVRESGEVMSRRGRVALLREQYPIARRHFEKSLELGNREAATLYYYSRLLREQGAPTAEIENLVVEAAQLQPTFPLARFAAGSSLLNRRQYGAALTHFSAAAKARPRWTEAWCALAFAYQGLGGQRQVQDALRLARRMAATPAEEAHVLEVTERIERWEQTPPTLALRFAEPPPREPEIEEQSEEEHVEVRLTRRPSATTRQEEQPAVPEPAPRVPIPTSSDAEPVPSAAPAEATERVEGLLQQVDCHGGTAILHVAVGGETVLLRVADPAKVKVVEQGEEKGSLTLACGPQPGHAVLLAYVAARDAQDGIVGDVVLLEVR